MSVDVVLLVCGLIVAVGGAVGVLVKAGRWAVRALRRAARLVDDLLGEPAHGDQPERPGLMSRVGRIETRLTRVEAQLLTGGGSMRDQLGRVERAVTDDQEETT